MVLKMSLVVRVARCLTENMASVCVTYGKKIMKMVKF